MSLRSLVLAGADVGSGTTALKRLASTTLVLVVGFVAASPVYGQDDPVPGLIEKLRDRDPAVRSKAATALNQLGPEAKDAIPALVATLQDEDAVVRQKAVIAMGLIRAHPEVAIPALRKAVKDRGALPEAEGTSITEAAIIAIGNYGPAAKDAVPDLLELARGEDYSPKQLAVGALGRIRSNPEQVIPLLRDILERKNEGYLKASAASSLSAFGPDPRSLALILKALPCEDVEDPYRKRVIQASLVRDIGRMSEYAQPVVGQLVAIFTDRKAAYHWQVRHSALQAITDLGPLAKEAAPPLVECLGSRDFAIYERDIVKALDSIGDDAIDPLIRNLQNPSDQARRATAEALGELGPKAAAAIPALEQAAQDQNLRVRDRAAEALKKIKQPQQKK